MLGGVSGRARPGDVDPLVEEMRQWYSEGESAASISRRVGLHESKVRRMLIAAGVTMRTRREQVAIKDVRVGARVPASDELRALYCEQNMTMEEIAERFGLTSARVSLLLRRHGIARRRAGARPEWIEAKRAARLTPELVATIVALHESGVSRNGVARQLDVDRHIVSEVIHGAGLEMRDHRKLPPVEVWADRYVNGGETASEIGATYGATGAAVLRALTQAGIERHPAQVRQGPLDESAVLACYVDEGLSIKATALRLGASVPRVRAMLDRHRLVEYRFDPTTIDRARFEKLYASGVAYEELAAEFGISSFRVRRAIRAFGLPLRPTHRQLDISDRSLESLVRRGLSDEDIAAKYEVAVHQVRQRRRRAGIRRPTHAPDIPVTRARLERLLACGQTRAAIATRQHVALATVTRWCAHYGLDVGYHRATPATGVEFDPKELRRLYVTEQWSTKQIGAELGVDPGLVAFALHSCRIPVRRPGNSHASVVLLDELYGDPDVVAVLERHGVPLRPRAGSLSRRFRRPPALTEKLVIELYTDVGLSATDISLLTGHSAAQVLDMLRRTGTPARPGSRSPWYQRTIQRA